MNPKVAEMVDDMRCTINTFEKWRWRSGTDEEVAYRAQLGPDEEPSFEGFAAFMQKRYQWQSVEDWFAETEQKKAENPDYDPTYGKFKRGGGDCPKKPLRMLF